MAIGARDAIAAANSAATHAAAPPPDAAAQAAEQAAAEAQAKQDYEDYKKLSYFGRVRHNLKGVISQDTKAELIAAGLIIGTFITMATGLFVPIAAVAIVGLVGRSLFRAAKKIRQAFKDAKLPSEAKDVKNMTKTPTKKGPTVRQAPTNTPTGPSVSPPTISTPVAAHTGGIPKGAQLVKGQTAKLGLRQPQAPAAIAQVAPLTPHYNHVAKGPLIVRGQSARLGLRQPQAPEPETPKHNMTPKGASIVKGQSARLGLKKPGAAKPA